MQIAITGAAGEVGRVVNEAFDEDDQTLLPTANTTSATANCSTPRTGVFEDAVAGSDALVHLAWSPADRGAWGGGDEGNVRMADNAFEAAIAGDLDRVVMASSAHAFGLYIRDDPTEFEAMVERPTTVRPDTPPRPVPFADRDDAATRLSTA